MSVKSDALGDRMKGYENISRNYLTRRVPVIVRIDGKAFHTFTRGLKKPFDSILMSAMQETMKFLCENIQGCVFGYTQSDEITLVLTDYKKITSDSWFGYNIQKMASVSASMATMAFNRFFQKEYNDIFAFSKDESQEYVQKLSDKLWSATFDSRVFTVPKEEVCNCLIWRQQDAVRNSIQSVGQANFSPKKLHGKTCDQVQEMLFQEKGINWDKLPTEQKRGTACYRREGTAEIPNPRNHTEMITVTRNNWVIDKEIPIFTQDREYVEKWL